MKSKSAKTFNRSRIIVIAICSVILLAILGTFAYFTFFSGVPFGHIMEHVSVAGVDVGGMTKAEAMETLEQTLTDTYSKTPLEITVLDETFEIPADVISEPLDLKSAVKAAYKCGRSGMPSHRKAQQKQAAEEGIQVDLQPILSVDTEKLDSALAGIASHFDSVLTESTYEITGDMPDLAGDAEEAPVQELVITNGAPGYDFRPEALQKALWDALNNNCFQVAYDCEVIEPAPLDLNKIYEENRIEPEDAAMDPKTFEVSMHKNGYDFDLEAAEQHLENAEPNEVITVPFRIVPPEHTHDALAALLFRDELSSYTARAGSNPNRDINLKLACQAINGKVLMPGEVFDYNTTLGKRTPEKGYRPAAGYVGNKTVNEYGGGICQPSSCLYYTAMLADLEIVQRTNHGFISSYMPFGMDATVSWGGPEFRFRNNTDYPIRIEAYASGGNVTMKLIGTDLKDYYVKMEYSVLNTDNYQVRYEEMSPDNEEGYKDGSVITTPYTGYTIATYRCKYDKETDALISRDHEVTSRYSRRDKVICKIVTPETEPPETTPPDTTPPETDPPETTAPETTPPETDPPEPPAPEEDTPE